VASLQARLRAQREAALKPKRRTFDVPGWNGMLAVRYRPVEWERLAELLERYVEDPREALAANCDALAEACDALVVCRDDEEAIPSKPEDQLTLADALRAQGEAVHGEVRFDDVAVEVLDLSIVDETGEKRPPKSARETVLAVFGGAVSPELAIRDQAARLGAWMRGVGAEVDASLVEG
jgi:hypothetical protein